MWDMANEDTRAGVRYADAKILDWTNRAHIKHDKALDAAARASETDGLPAIHLGPSEAKLLHLLAGMIGAKKVVEIGTLAGYTAIWLARALPEDGTLYCLELDEHAASVARRNLEAAGLGDRSRVIVGPALESLKEIAGEAPFCMVFIDADKAGYAEYARQTIALLREGGLLVGDNCFLFGRLLDEGDPAAISMRSFHQEVAFALESTCVPTPDGLVIGRKISNAT